MSGVIHVGVSGARGRMGRAVGQVLDAREDLVVAARFDRGETPDLSLCDVVIDFSTPDASVELARHVAARGGPALVIGSTGLSDDQEAEITKAAETVAIVRSGNFSLGVNILVGLVERAAARLDAADWDIEVLESHHRKKVDAPSGTALMLGEAAAMGRHADLAELRIAAREGITGERPVGGIGFAALRAGGIVGDHTVLFAGTGERIEITHKSSSRVTYAQGSLRAVRFLADKTSGLYDMYDVLGLH